MVVARAQEGYQANPVAEIKRSAEVCREAGNSGNSGAEKSL